MTVTVTREGRGRLPVQCCLQPEAHRHAAGPGHSLPGRPGCSRQPTPSPSRTPARRALAGGTPLAAASAASLPAASECQFDSESRRSSNLNPGRHAGGPLALPVSCPARRRHRRRTPSPRRPSRRRVRVTVCQSRCAGVRPVRPRHCGASPRGPSGNPRKFRHGIYLVYTWYMLLAIVILVYTRYMTGICFLEKKYICIPLNACMHAMITSQVYNSSCTQAGRGPF